MKNHHRHLLTILIAAFCGLVGWWLAREPARRTVKAQSVVPQEEPRAAGPLARSTKVVRHDEFRDGTTVEMFASKNPEEVILRFPSDESYESFLYALQGSKIELVDRLDRLRAVRIGYEEWSDLSDMLTGENIFAYDSLPSVPTPGPVGSKQQENLVGFSDGMLSWLGIHGDNSKWGAGVKIAVLDSGVVPNAGLPGLTKSVEITPFPEDLNKTHGHGTAVASLIAGNDPFAPGIAPAAEIVSIRVSDESGKADSFALAAGILAGIDSGAQIINISMGCVEDNPLIEEAVLYANVRNVLIVAASGNSEGAEACYPAAYPSVISVGAVDARGEHLDFSNYGTYLSLTAPGYGVNAAWPGNRYASISGTSASAPIVTGAIAATMSNQGHATMSATQAADILMKHADDAGIPGPDSEYGFGILNMARVMNRGLAGIVDAAITNQRIVKSGSGGSAEIQVTLQNRGTVVLVNTLLQVGTPFGVRQFNAGSMIPGAIQTFSVPVNLGGLPQDRPLRVESTLTLGTPGYDVTPHNNERTDELFWK